MAGEETPSVLRQYGDTVTAKDVLDAAKAGDELALSVVESEGRYLGAAWPALPDGRFRRCLSSAVVYQRQASS